MQTRIAVVAVLVAISLLPSCSRTLLLRIPVGAPVELKRFVVAGVDAQAQTKLLHPVSPEYQRLNDWVARNQSGWSQSFATTPSQGVVAHVTGLTLHFVDDIVYASTDAGRFQKNIQKDDYAYLEAALGI